VRLTTEQSSPGVPEIGSRDCSDKYCIIGAGPSGLAALKNLKQLGIPGDCFEREADVGGVWNYGQASSGVYNSIHLITSGLTTAYVDYPFPEDYPYFPNHRQALAYLRGYANHFGLYDDITFECGVRAVQPVDGGWSVLLDDSDVPRCYRGVIIANGHHWDPRIPEVAGDFTGEIMHSHQYKTPDVLRGRRVLVVGAGNSGCDIAVEAAQNAAATFLSMRRGYYFLPKFLFGRPAEHAGEFMHRLRLPLWLRRWLALRLLELTVGSPQDYGLPAPDHRLFETHPVGNSLLYYYLGHGDICVKQNIERFSGDHVHFVDDSVERIDLIVFATGYRISFPFIDNRHVLDDEQRPRLFLNAFHPQFDNLFVVGLLQPDSGAWGLADYQSQLIAQFICAQDRQAPSADWFRRLKASDQVDLSSGIRYVDSARHSLEVEHFGYRRRLRKLIARFARSNRRHHRSRDASAMKRP